jgi:plasmid stabilization system protein ParE
MVTYRVIITPRAGADLERIHDYIAKDSPQNAQAMVKRILDALEPLKQFPNRTVAQRQATGLRHPVRMLPVKPYTIYFRVIDEFNAVRILHIRHAARLRPRW